MRAGPWSHTQEGVSLVSTVIRVADWEVMFQGRGPG